MRARHGENFFYMLYFQEQAAERELNARTRELFEKLFTSPGTPRENPLIRDPLASAGGFLDRIGKPLQPAEWISPSQLDYFVDVYSRTGFLGGLNYYRSFDLTWEILRKSESRVLEAPAMFIAGEKDFLLQGRGEEELAAGMKTLTPNVAVHLLADAGHWVQQEKPAEVNRILLAFLRSLR
jgi:pimeloyl-ACP methyl ester carboxylesterase